MGAVARTTALALYTSTNWAQQNCKGQGDWFGEHHDDEKIDGRGRLNRREGLGTHDG
jgi:hypothetical protein